VDDLKICHFAPFSQFLHIKGLKIPDILYPFTSTYDPYEPLKFSWKSVRTFLRNPEDRHTTHTHTDRHGNFIFIDERNYGCSCLPIRNSGVTGSKFTKCLHNAGTSSEKFQKSEWRYCNSFMNARPTNKSE